MFNTKMKFQWEFLVPNQMSYNKEDKSQKKERRNLSKVFTSKPFLQKGCNGRTLSPASKRHPCRIFFPECSIALIAPQKSKIRDQYSY